MGQWPKWWKYSLADTEGYGGYDGTDPETACSVCGKRVAMYYPYEGDGTQPRAGVKDAISYPGLKFTSWSNMLESNEYLKIFSDRKVKPGSKKGRAVAQKIGEVCTKCRKYKSNNYEEAEKVYKTRLPRGYQKQKTNQKWTAGKVVKKTKPSWYES